MPVDAMLSERLKDAVFFENISTVNFEAVIEEKGKFSYCPIFDNGAGLLSNIQFSPIEDYLISGDTLFYGSFGRTDFPTGDMETLVSSINKLFSLTQDYVVLSGHGAQTKLSNERVNNPIKYYG